MKQRNVQDHHGFDGAGKYRLFAAAAMILLAVASNADEIIAPDRAMNPLERPAETLHIHVNPEKSVDPDLTEEDVFVFDKSDKLTITGETWGYIRTKASYRDYHLVLEYRFTGPTSGSRAEKARDSGLLLHCFGEDGSRGGGTWIPCIEVQVMEGATGDFIVLGPYDDQENLLPIHLESTGVFDDRVPFYDPKGEPRIMPKVGVGNNAMRNALRSRQYREVKDWHSETDADFSTESQLWNRVDVIADGDKIDVYVNGHLVNRGWNAKPAGGWIGIQSEGAEVEYRKWQLHPLGAIGVPPVEAQAEK